MEFLEATLARAKSLQKRLVMTGGTEIETLEAAKVVMTERLASSVTLLGKESEINKVATREGVDISDMSIVNPELCPDLSKYTNEYFELRKMRGMTMEQAKIDIVKPLNWGAMMVRLGAADAVVAGVNDDSVDVFFAGLAIIGTAPNIRTASSCTIVVGKDLSMGVDGAFIFSDCSIVTNPLPDQLSDIAQCAAQSCRDLLRVEPVVALLSHSTKGLKREHKDIEKIRIALDMIKYREPSLIVDGELQVNAALVPSITDARVPDTPVRGKVNTLIFPDMDAGNIAYQTARVFGKAEVFGPFLQGFAKPISYISRGSELSSAVITCAATLVRVH